MSTRVAAAFTATGIPSTSFCLIMLATAMGTTYQYHGAHFPAFFFTSFMVALLRGRESPVQQYFSIVRMAPVALAAVSSLSSFFAAPITDFVAPLGSDSGVDDCSACRIAEERLSAKWFLTAGSADIHALVAKQTRSFLSASDAGPALHELSSSVLIAAATAHVVRIPVIRS